MLVKGLYIHMLSNDKLESTCLINREQRIIRQVICLSELTEDTYGMDDDVKLCLRD